MARIDELEVRRFGTDLLLEDTVNRGAASAGQAPTVSGRENVFNAVRMAFQTVPGELLHRPDYGAGLAEFVGTLNTTANRARAAQQARRTLIADPRIDDAAVSVSETDIPTESLVEARIVLRTEDQSIDLETNITIPGV